MNKLKIIISNELSAYSKLEISASAVALFAVLLCSLIKSDSFLAISASVFGLLYTISSGKGKVYCYYFGIIATLCCAVVSFQIPLYGNALLHFAYYLPMEIVGLYSWKKHLQSNTNEIVKTKLTPFGLVGLIFCVCVFTFVCHQIFVNIKDASPLADALILVLSVSGMLLTVKRCIEQWIVWTLVNIFSIWMWMEVFLQGERTFSIFLVRIIYLIIGIYFYLSWKRSFRKTI